MKESGLPLVLHLVRKNVAIVGGGLVAERKIKSLLDSGARITVISPQTTDQIQKWVEEKRIEWRRKVFEAEDIAQAQLVIAATNRRNVNDHVWKATAHHQWVCVVDDRQKSSFTVPARIRRGKLCISVSTSGASPGLARRITRQMEEQFDDAYTAYVDFLDRCRQTVQEEFRDTQIRKRILTELLQPDLLHLSEREREYRFQQLCQTIKNERSTDG
jgi:precorrin-2 dehydrogenase/sirohydrochlorin ferrochelatase